VKLKSLTVQNIRSFSAEKRIEFNDDFSILIGPNGGGKSNILDIITITMRQYLFPPYGVTRQSDVSGPFLRFESETPFGNIHHELAKFYGAKEPSRIAMEFVLSDQDILNIQWITEHHADLLSFSDEYRGGRDSLDGLKGLQPEQFKTSDVITFEVVDGNLVQPTDQKHQSLLRFLRLFNKVAIILEKNTHRLTTPFVHFPPYRGVAPDGLRVSLASQNRWNIEIGHARSTSRQTYSLIPLATFHFARKHRQLEFKASQSGYKQAFWGDPEVKQVTETLYRLGYEWDLTVKDADQNLYEITLKRDGQQFDLSSASSGEKELINFVFGIFALNVRNGLVTIDEPELHLHPKWQRILYGLLETLQEKTGNQFLLATHAASFITPKTLGKMTRVARKDKHSEVTKLDAQGVAGQKDLLQMINSHNNEKLFFADIVVLVEGVQDRVLLERLLEDRQTEIASLTPDEAKKAPPVVEVLEVHGKGNLQRYRQLLESARIRSFIIADRDYAEQIGPPEVKALFQPDEGKAANRTLFDEMSKDRKAFGEAVSHAVAAGDPKQLQELWDYITSRFKRFKDPLTEAQRQTFDAFVSRQATEGTFVLRRGEIEAYLPDTYTSLDKTIELVTAPNFRELMAQKPAHFDEIKHICHAILPAAPRESKAMLPQVGDE
jgi:predicted ATP-dependent endonuclease of OLD family